MWVGTDVGKRKALSLQEELFSHEMYDKDRNGREAVNSCTELLSGGKQAMWYQVKACST